MKCLYVELYSGSTRKFTKITKKSYLNIYKVHIASTGGTIPSFDKVFKYNQIFGGFYMVRQIIPNFWT